MIDVAGAAKHKQFKSKGRGCRTRLPPGPMWVLSRQKKMTIMLYVWHSENVIQGGKLQYKSNFVNYIVDYILTGQLINFTVA